MSTNVLCVKGSLGWEQLHPLDDVAGLNFCSLLPVLLSLFLWQLQQKLWQPGCYKALLESKGHCWDRTLCWQLEMGAAKQQLWWNWGSAKKSRVNLIWPSFTCCAVTRGNGHASLPVPLLCHDGKEKKTVPETDVLCLGC